MSLADLVPVIAETHMKRLALTPSERHRKWQKENRGYVSAYRRKWRQKRREKGLPVT